MSFGEIITAAIGTIVFLYIGVPVFLFLARVLGLYAIVEERTYRVYTLFGKVVGTIDQPGLHSCRPKSAWPRWGLRSSASAMCWTCGLTRNTGAVKP